MGHQKPEGVPTQDSASARSVERGTWRRLPEILGPGGSRAIGLLGAASVLSGLVEALLLSMLVHVASALSSGQDSVAVDLGPMGFGSSLGVAALLGIVALLAVFRGGLQFVAAFIPARLVADLQARFRNEILDLYLGSPWPVQARDREGELQDLLTYQVNYGTHGVSAAASTFIAFLTFSALVVSAFAIDPAAAIVMIVAGVLLFAIFRPVSRIVRRSASKVAAANGVYAADISETVRMAMEIKTFGVQGAKSSSLQARVEQVRHPLLRSNFAAYAGHGLHQVVAVLFVVGGLVVLDIAATARVASLGAVVLVLVRAAAYAGTAQNSFHLVNQYAPHLDRLIAAKKAYAAATLLDGGRPLTAIDEVCLDGVSFSYAPERPVLREASLVAKKGEAIGVVGPSGSGKSTCVQLLLRLRAPTSGEYRINGLRADCYRQADWSQRVACVPQDPNVLTASVADNIRFLRDDIDDAEIVRAAKLAHIHDEIVQLPEGYDTVIGQRADALSGGQRQRVCLARALAGRPELLVLDEPTSALDARSELLVRESLQELKGNITLVIVAHRVALFDICDRTMALRDGRLEPFQEAAVDARTGGVL